MYKCMSLEATISYERLLRQFEWINICCLNPGIQTGGERTGFSINPAISHSYFCPYHNPDVECIGDKEIRKESRPHTGHLTLVVSVKFTLGK